MSLNNYKSNSNSFSQGSINNNITNKEKAVILFSGGLDSSTLLYWMANLGYDLFPLSFCYGQRHQVELAFAKKIIANFKFANAKNFGNKLLENHQIVNISLDLFNQSALINKNINVDSRNLTEILADNSKVDFVKIPNTYVPARNSIFLSYAFGYAETVGASKIIIGVNAVDYSGYPDCRPQFIDAFQNLINNAYNPQPNLPKINILAPLINLSKVEIIKIGLQFGLDYSNSFSCYNPIVGKILPAELTKISHHIISNFYKQEVLNKEDSNNFTNNLAGITTNEQQQYFVKNNILVTNCGKCDSCLIRSDAFASCNIEIANQYFLPVKFL